jgi:hypothetical protein
MRRSCPLAGGNSSGGGGSARAEVIRGAIVAICDAAPPKKRAPMAFSASDARFVAASRRF